MDAMTPPDMMAKSGALRQREYRARYGATYREKHKLEARAWRAKNSEVLNEKARAYRARNPDMVRSANLKKTHGITLDQFNDLFKSQGSACAICKGVSPKGKNWHVDHCHSNGNIRGILCHPCNLMIGQAADNPETLLAGAKYLRGFG
jgi:hypothetical protein